MASKAKVSFAQAWERAQFWRDCLTSFVDRIAVAGSLRRMKPKVSDIEIVYVPKMALKPLDIFESTFGAIVPLVDLAGAFLDQALKEGMLTKRVGEANHTSWGPLNKLGVDVKSGIAIDFFGCSAERFPMLLAIRTGPKELNIKLANAAARRGWELKPYEGGYRNRRTGEMHICPTEEDVFRFVGIQPAPPTHRV